MEDNMGYKKMDQNISFAELALESSLKRGVEKIFCKKSGVSL